jgi:hypothetical protein
MLQVFHLDVAKLDRDVPYIYASVSSIFIHTLQVFYLVFAMAIHVFLVFFLVFCNVSDIYCKNRPGAAHVAMRVRSGGDASGPCARFDDTGPMWAREMQA